MAFFLKHSQASLGLSLLAMVTIVSGSNQPSGAISVSPAVKQTAPPPAQTIAQANQRESPWICRLLDESFKDVYYAETRTYFVNICETSSGSLVYYGANRRNGQSIQVDAFRSAKGPYVAENGNISYVVGNRRLIVYQGDKVILYEPIIKEFSK